MSNLAKNKPLVINLKFIYFALVCWFDLLERFHSHASYLNTQKQSVNWNILASTFYTDHCVIPIHPRFSLIPDTWYRCPSDCWLNVVNYQKAAWSLRFILTSLGLMNCCWSKSPRLVAWEPSRGRKSTWCGRGNWKDLSFLLRYLCPDSCSDERRDTV